MSRTIERLGNVELIQDAITQRGGYWMWMVANRFPLDSLATQDTPSFITHGVSNNDHTLSMVERLPLELIYMIALESSLTSLLSLTSSSRVLRSMLLGSESSRNSLAAAWVVKNAPWYVPATSGLEAQYEMHKIRDPWAYLQRYFASSSMRNRARIWKVAEQIEETARQIGLCD